MSIRRPAFLLKSGGGFESAGHERRGAGGVWSFDPLQILYRLQRRAVELVDDRLHGIGQIALVDSLSFLKVLLGSSKFADCRPSFLRGWTCMAAQFRTSFAPIGRALDNCGGV